MATKKTKKFGIGGRAFGPAAPGLVNQPISGNPTGGQPRPASLNPLTINPIRTPGGGGKPAPVNQPISGNPMGGQPRPRPTPTGPMVPVRGGGMAPASIATMMKKGGKVRGCGIAQRGLTKGKMR